MIGTIATYSYSEYLYELGFARYTAKVEILGETPKTYKVKLLTPNVRGHKLHDIIKVQTKNIILPKEKKDCSDAWYHDC